MGWQQKRVTGKSDMVAWDKINDRTSSLCQGYEYAGETRSTISVDKATDNDESQNYWGQYHSGSEERNILMFNRLH